MNDDGRRNDPAPVTREEYEQLLFDQKLLETDVARLAESVRDLSNLFARHVSFTPSRAVYDVRRAGDKAEAALRRITARWKTQGLPTSKSDGDAG